MISVNIKQYWVSTSVLSVIMVKPLIDLFWSYRFDILGRGINLQSLIGCLAILYSQIYAIKYIIREKRVCYNNFVPFFYLCFTALCIYRLVFNPEQLREILVYLSAFSGFIIFESLKTFLKRLNKQEISRFLFLGCLSFLIVSLLGVFQLSGFIDYYVADFVDDDRIRFNRLTAGYSHPLELARTFIWIYFLGILMFIDTLKFSYSYPILYIQYLFIHTTHRATCLLSLFGGIAIAIYQRHKYRSLKKRIKYVCMLVFSIFLIWTLGTSFSESLSLGKIFHIDHFVKNKNIGRGRGGIWKKHFEWIGGFSFSEYLVGTDRAFPYKEFRGVYTHQYVGMKGLPKQDISYADTHSQYLDIFERFGIVGLLCVVALVFFYLKRYKGERVYVYTFIFVILLYSLITRNIITPSFIWWGLLFLHLGPIFQERLQKKI